MNLILIMTKVKTLSHINIGCMANERLQRHKQFYSKNCFLEMPRSDAKIYLKIASQKLSFVMEKAISKR